MDGSEPTFVPEWYKGANSNVAGSVNSNHNSGSLHSALVEHNKFSSRNRLSVSQTMVIESLTDFKVQYYVGNRKHLKDQNEWSKEIEQIEVLVMAPQILLHNLRHCFIRMELIALLIFDECHHAQAQTRHPYAQIMKEFYKTNTTKYPWIFGMTASPIIGKGGVQSVELYEMYQQS